MSVKKITAPKKIEIEAEAKDGSMKHFECPEITQDMTESVFEISKKMDKGSISPGKALREQCAIFFGGKESDYMCYDVRIITQIVNFVTEQIKNPS